MEDLIDLNFEILPVQMYQQSLYERTNVLNEIFSSVDSLSRL